MYTYDADGLRSSKTTDAGAEYYVYDGDQLVATIRDNLIAQFALSRQNGEQVRMPALVEQKDYSVIVNGQTYTGRAELVQGEGGQPTPARIIIIGGEETPEIPPVTNTDRIVLKAGPVSMEMEVTGHPRGEDRLETVHVIGPANTAISIYIGDPDPSADVYVRGLNLIASVTDGQATYYHYNAHGDVVQTTDATGTVLHDYSYDAFGVELNAAEGDTNPFRYCGEQFDAETGNYYLRARTYSPTTGRFTQEDPIRDGLNWYGYCGNDPVNMIDPNGLDAIVITNQNSVPLGPLGTQGHTSAIYQDENGNWFYTFWGNKAAAVIRMPDSYIKEYRREGDLLGNSMDSLEDFNNALNRILQANGFENITSNYTHATYIVGDFATSLDYAYVDVHQAARDEWSNGTVTKLDDGSEVFQGRNGAYNALWRNCFQKTYDSLSKGTLASNRNVGGYMQELGFYGGVIPNNAISEFREVFMHRSFTYSGAAQSLSNYRDLYYNGSPWAKNWTKAYYAISVVGQF